MGRVLHFFKKDSCCSEKKERKKTFEQLFEQTVNVVWAFDWPKLLYSAELFRKTTSFRSLVTDEPEFLSFSKAFVAVEGFDLILPLKLGV